MADTNIALETAGTKRKRVDATLTITVTRRNEAGLQWFGLRYQNSDWVYCCNVCQECFTRNRVELSRLTKHEESKRHQRAKSAIKITDAFYEQESRQRYHEDIGAHILSNNIPLTRILTLFHTSFVGSVVARKERSLLSPSSYRCSYCPAAHARWRGQLISNFLYGQPFSLLVDESSKNNRKVINSIAVTVGGNILIETKVYEGDESINADSVCQYIQDLLVDCGLSPELLVGITRDNASYMTAAMDKLRAIPFYSHVLSVSCLSHGLNLVVRDLLNPFSIIKDQLFGSLKKLFGRPCKRRTRASKKLPGFINAVQVSETRWSGWLESISFVYDNLQDIAVLFLFIVPLIKN
tara:strand:- start:68 stop:1123 length:1056 start_codon:yes stop_codon:yes gene_type:complete